MKKTTEREVRIWLEKCGFEMISVPTLDPNNYWNVVVVDQSGALLRMRFADDVLVRGLVQVGYS
jgi:predicted xylose isomerase-like sugar epimerase